MVARSAVPRLFVGMFGVAVMIAAATTVYARALHESEPDHGCSSNCSTVVTPNGESFSDLSPSLFLGATLAGIAGAIAASMSHTPGRSRRARCVDAVALCAVFWIAVVPLTFHGRDWHGDADFLWTAALGLLSFPVGLAVWGVVRAAKAPLPYLWGDPSFGPFSATLGLRLGLLAVAGYVQWFVFVPSLRQRSRRRRLTLPPG